MATSNLNGDSQVYVSAEEADYPDQNLPLPLLRIIVNVVSTYQCDTDNTNTYTNQNSTQEFEYPFDRFGSAPSPESDAVVSDMLSSVEIPFSLENLYELYSLNGDRFVTPLNSINDMVRMITVVACQMVREGRGRTSLVMDLRIENLVIVQEPPSLEFLSPRSRGRTLHEAIADLIGTISGDTLLTGEGPTVMMRRVAPAAKESVEVLEKFRYDGVSSKVEEMTCPICIEEVLSGTQVTKMPCSHLFHGDCILKWLEKHHTCPLCRFKLPTN